MRQVPSGASRSERRQTTTSTAQQDVAYAVHLAFHRLRAHCSRAQTVRTFLHSQPPSRYSLLKLFCCLLVLSCLCVCAGIRLCFRQAGTPLPPWREGRAMLSKWVTELHSDEPVPVVPLPDTALRRLLAPYHTPFRTAVQQARNPSAAAGAGAGGFSKHQQQQGAYAGAGQGSNTAALPPLPPSSVAAQRPAQQHAADAAEHSAHHHVVPDVPKKIIVGFPVASPPSPALQQQLAYATDQDMTVIVVPSAAAVRSIAKLAQQQQVQGAASAVSVPTKQQAHAQGSNGNTGPVTQGKIEQGQQQRAAANARTVTQADAGTRVVQALVQVDGCIRTQSAANSQNPAASPAVTASSKASAAPAARPAFASTTGVVVATAGGTSPGIVVNKQLVQQLTEGVISGSSADKGKALAAGAVAAVAAAVGGVDSTGSNGGSDASQGAAGAATAAAAARQFKSLDQLLPRMRTVKLGAG